MKLLLLKLLNHCEGVSAWCLTRQSCKTPHIKSVTSRSLRSKSDSCHVTRRWSAFCLGISAGFSPSFHSQNKLRTFVPNSFNGSKWNGGIINNYSNYSSWPRLITNTDHLIWTQRDNEVLTGEMLTAPSLSVADPDSQSQSQVRPGVGVSSVLSCLS